MQTPIFAFSAGWRSGSTMLQRLITSTGQYLVWGEAGSALERFADAFSHYEQMLGPGGQLYEHGFGGNGAEEYDKFVAAGKHGFNEWIACMNPPAETFTLSFRALFESIYARPALELGYGGWGIKAVRSGRNTAQFLRALYPGAKFVLLVRHPVACLTSIKRRKWLDRPNDPKALEYYANHWLQLAREFRQMDYGKLIKHEDLVSSSETREQLASFLGLSTLSSRFKDLTWADWRSENDDALSSREKTRLLGIVRDEMERHGYK